MLRLIDDKTENQRLRVTQGYSTGDRALLFLQDFLIQFKCVASFFQAQQSPWFLGYFFFSHTFMTVPETSE